MTEVKAKVAQKEVLDLSLSKEEIKANIAKRKKTLDFFIKNEAEIKKAKAKRA